MCSRTITATNRTATPGKIINIGPYKTAITRQTINAIVYGIKIAPKDENWDFWATAMKEIKCLNVRRKED